MSALLIRIGVSALLLTLAAIAAERSLRAARVPVRAVWLGAIAGTIVVTLLLASGAPLPLRVPIPAGAVAHQPAGALGVVDADASGERVLGLAWAALSVLLLVALGFASRLQARRLSGCPRRSVAGVDVLVTNGLGPAVAGVFRTRIVVPPWVLDLPDEQRALIVRHEAEHAGARDHLLWTGALVLCCLLPWNPLVWYQLHRLRMAIEIDCDARVVRREVGALGVYGLLLIDVAERMARGTPLATALVHPRSFLERRIRMIVHHTRRPVHAAAWAVGAALLIAGACADAEPTTPDIGALDARTSTLEPAGELRPADAEPIATRILAPTVESEEGPTLERIGAAEGKFRVELVDDAVASAEPAPGRSGIVRFRATLDEEGRTTDLQVEPGTPADLEERALSSLERVRFRRSELSPRSDEPVEGVITLP